MTIHLVIAFVRQKHKMNTTILLVGHGSRHKPGNVEVGRFLATWRKKNPQWRIETCFIEFAEIMLDKGLDNAAKNSDKVVVVPLILNAAGHVKAEIPHHIQHAIERHSNVEFIYAEHIGATESILTILKRNLLKVLAQMHMPDPKTTGVILLGRGSSDRVANGEIAKMARWLFDETDHELIDVAFTGITHPRLELVVQRQVKLDMRQVAVLPYYLFTGTLIERISKQVIRLQSQYPQVAIECGSYFGFEEEIYAMLDERVAHANDVNYISQIMQQFLAGDVEHHPHNHDDTHSHTSDG